MTEALPTTDEIIEVVREYLLREFLPGESASALDNSTRLIKNSVLDSLTTVKLVTYLEERYHIEVLPHELDAEHLDTLPAIAALVRAKLEKGKSGSP
jgi:acyl carrier protein